jgi:hypothetical protein
MLESGLSGSVRGVPSNGHPYRDPGPMADIVGTRDEANEQFKRPSFEQPDFRRFGREAPN